MPRHTPGSGADTWVCPYRASSALVGAHPCVRPFRRRKCNLLDDPPSMSERTAIRPFRDSDLPLGMKLKELAGWNQLEADWRRFVTLQPDGCFVAEIDGEAAGTATTTQYGERFGWVGMVLVLPEKRRQGVGTSLLRHCIAYLEGRGVASVKLDATPLGKQLYDTLGFVDEYPIERKQVAAAPVVQSGRAEAKRMTAGHIAALARYDEPIFGAARAAHLALLLAQNPNGCFVHTDAAGQIDGYVFSRPGANAAQIGPLAANDPATADALFRAALSPFAGQPVLVDVPMTHTGPSEIAARYGFQTQRPLTRMYRGHNAYPGDVSRVYAFCGPETG